MASDNHYPPVCCHRNIPFPSDGIRLGLIRELDPVFFRLDNLAQPSMTKNLALKIVIMEMILADKVFAREYGRTDPHPQVGQGEVYDALKYGYAVYGLSAGPLSARTLIERLESAARLEAHKSQQRAK